jgi:hypothetical protein
MNYEYLKGSGKDFEGAPDWAHQVIKSTSIYGYAFVEEFDYMCKYQSKENPYDVGNISNPTLWEVIAVRKPITEPSWDGVGLPPVGCECEFTLGPYEPDEFDDLCGKLPELGTLVNVVSHKVTGDGHNVAVIYWDEDGGGRAACLVGSCLKPICSEADKKRDAAIKALDDWFPEYTTDIPSLYHATAMYAAIAAGSIPGVKLED